MILATFHESMSARKSNYSRLIKFMIMFLQILPDRKTYLMRVEFAFEKQFLLYNLNLLYLFV